MKRSQQYTVTLCLALSLFLVGCEPEQRTLDGTSVEAFRSSLARISGQLDTPERQNLIGALKKIQSEHYNKWDETLDNPGVEFLATIQGMTRHEIRVTARAIKQEQAREEIRAAFASDRDTVEQLRRDIAKLTARQQDLKRIEDTVELIDLSDAHYRVVKRETGIASFDEAMVGSPHVAFTATNNSAHWFASRAGLSHESLCRAARWAVSFHLTATGASTAAF